MKFLCVVIILFYYQWAQAQAITLDADGPGNTYELITSVLAPGYDPVEEPDCNHTDFGRHIDEVWDTDLMGYVFNFHIHVTPDDDRCINFDRQRNEIKSYSQSPANLVAVAGEEVVYKWKFKLDSGFQPSSSFTHIHQIKAVGGSESSMPLITLTLRKATPDRLELRYAESTSQITWTTADLSLFLGTWVEATETITYGENGTYEVELKNVNTGAVLLSYADSNIRMWRTDASIIRPKWGIYRSLNNSADLRDEQVLFANFSIEEIVDLPVDLIYFKAKERKEYNLLEWETAEELNNDHFLVTYSTDGISFFPIEKIKGKGTTVNRTTYQYKDYNNLTGKVYYRLQQVDLNGEFTYSPVVNITRKEDLIQVFPNPTKGHIQLYGLKGFKNIEIQVKSIQGNVLLTKQWRTQNNHTIDLSSLNTGLYLIQITGNEQSFIHKILKK